MWRNEYKIIGKKNFYFVFEYKTDTYYIYL